MAYQKHSFACDGLITVLLGWHDDVSLLTVCAFRQSHIKPSMQNWFTNRCNYQNVNWSWLIILFRHWSIIHRIVFNKLYWSRVRNTVTHCAALYFILPWCHICHITLFAVWRYHSLGHEWSNLCIARAPWPNNRHITFPRKYICKLIIKRMLANIFV